MTAAQVEDFFKRYADAFSRFDIDEICTMWAYPAYIAGRGKRASLTEDEFRANTAALCAFYDRQGMKKARKQVVELARLIGGTTAVRTADQVFDGEGSVIAAWEHVYVLSETTDGIKAITALPDEELDAWDARGTPMGSW